MTTSAPLTRDDLPVTVSFTRRADPAHAREMTAWIRPGLSMAESFPGFLGAGWVRSRRNADEWHMLARFADHATLTAWEASPERQWWLRSAQGLAEVIRTERFEARIGAACRYCPFRGSCPTQSSGQQVVA